MRGGGRKLIGSSCFCVSIERRLLHCSSWVLSEIVAAVGIVFFAIVSEDASGDVIAMRVQIQNLKVLAENVMEDGLARTEVSQAVDAVQACKICSCGFHHMLRNRIILKYAMTYGAGVVLTSLVTLPNWPFLNRNPLPWEDPSEAEKHPKSLTLVTLKKGHAALLKIDY